MFLQTSSQVGVWGIIVDLRSLARCTKSTSIGPFLWLKRYGGRHDHLSQIPMLRDDVYHRGRNFQIESSFSVWLELISLFFAKKEGIGRGSTHETTRTKLDDKREPRRALGWELKIHKEYFVVKQGLEINKERLTFIKSLSSARLRARI
jgi:hypothetical protein